jgi:exodeoxyribonuclease V alpha subunit
VGVPILVDDPGPATFGSPTLAAVPPDTVTDAVATRVTPGDAVFDAFCAAGLWPGLGSTLAGRLTDSGVRGPADVSAARLAALPGISAKRAERLAAAFAEAAATYDVVRQLVPARLPARLASEVVSALGDDAARQLRLDPWRLLEVIQARPEQADVLAATVLDDPNRSDPRRGAALAEYALRRAARDGHTAIPPAALRSVLTGLYVPDPTAAMQAALTETRLVAFDDEGLVALASYARAEEALAEGLGRLLDSAEPLCTPEGATAVVTAELDDAQAEAVRTVAAHGVCILTGGPGTGKSRTVAAVVALAKARGRRIALAAPTSRAAKRLEELTGEPAVTVHRLLGAQGRTGEFARGQSWPLDADVVVVDETSMLDVELAAALIEACDDGTHLLFVGDPAQLPSIGAGRVLGDMLDAGTIPVVELHTLHRQAAGGAIARLATAVRSGTLPPVDSPDREVVLVPASGSPTAAIRTVQLVTDSIPRALGIAAADVQVVTPVHRGPAGTTALNAALKAALNPGPGELGGFDPGDRVVSTANHIDEGFANGEVGVVSAIADKGLIVEFAAGTVTVAPRFVGDLRHGWAITVHRAQGSEWPAVVAVLPPEASGLLSRPLIYTALTRARRHLSVVHAAGPVVARAVREVGARPRRTRLRTLLAAATAGGKAARYQGTKETVEGRLEAL